MVESGSCLLYLARLPVGGGANSIQQSPRSVRPEGYAVRLQSLDRDQPHVRANRKSAVPPRSSGGRQNMRTLYGIAADSPESRWPAMWRAIFGAPAVHRAGRDHHWLPTVGEFRSRVGDPARRAAGVGSRSCNPARCFGACSRLAGLSYGYASSASRLSAAALGFPLAALPDRPPDFDPALCDRARRDVCAKSVCARPSHSRCGSPARPLPASASPSWCAACFAGRLATPSGFRNPRRSSVT